MKVNILGEDYEIIKQTKAENSKLKQAYGICETYSKKIVIDSEIDEETLKDDVMTVERLDLFVNKVLRHEIIHAFFAESGLKSNCNYADNEELVDWIAIQFPKMLKVFKELDVLE